VGKPRAPKDTYSSLCISPSYTLASVESPENAWHYTSAAGLVSILTRHKLWATSAAYMNDKDEINAGRLALRRAIKSREPAVEQWQLDQLSAIGVTRPGNPHDLFLLCASSDGDALTLWRSYGIGSEAEYAIDLDPSIALLPIQQDASQRHPEPAPPGWGDDAIEHDNEGRPFLSYDPDHAYTYGGLWSEVEYLKPTNTAAARELEQLLSTMKRPTHNRRVMPFNLDYLAGPDPTANFKHPGFTDEREVRATWTVQPWWRFVLYRPGRFGATPYIEVATSESVEGHQDREQQNFIRPEHVERLPIRAVRIGPTRAAADAKKSLRMLLDSNGYGAVDIEQSSTPYR